MHHSLGEGQHSANTFDKGAAKPVRSRIDQYIASISGRDGHVLKF